MSDFFLSDQEPMSLSLCQREGLTGQTGRNGSALRLSKVTERIFKRSWMLGVAMATPSIQEVPAAPVPRPFCAVYTAWRNRINSSKVALDHELHTYPVERICPDSGLGS